MCRYQSFADIDPRVADGTQNSSGSGQVEFCGGLFRMADFRRCPVEEAVVRDYVERLDVLVQTKRILIPVGAGLLAAVFLAALYLGIVSWAESPKHALDLFRQDRWLIIPIITGFGVQAGLYTTLKLRLFVPAAQAGPSGALTGTGGATSTIAMVACCAHHVTDVLPILGLTAAATFLAEYKTPFMVGGLATNMVGIAVMLTILFKERQKAIRTAAIPSPSLQGD